MSYNLVKAMEISNTSFTQNPQLNITTRTHPHTKSDSSPLYIPKMHKIQIHIFVSHVILSFN